MTDRPEEGLPADELLAALRSPKRPVVVPRDVFDLLDARCKSGDLPKEWKTHDSEVMCRAVEDQCAELQSLCDTKQREIERLRVHERELRIIVHDYSHEDCDEDFQEVWQRASDRLHAEDTLRALHPQKGTE